MARPQGTFGAVLVGRQFHRPRLLVLPDDRQQ